MQDAWPNRWRRRLIVILVFDGLLALLMLVMAMPWLGRTFPGFLIDSELNTNALVCASWTGAAAGILPFDQIVGFQGQPITNSQAIFDQVAAAPPGTPFSYQVMREGAPPIERIVPSMRFGQVDFITMFVGFWLGGVIHIMVGALVAWLRPLDASARSHWRYCQAFGLWAMLNFETGTTGYSNLFVMVVAAYLTWTVVDLGLTFPVVRGTSRQRRLVLGACGLVCGLLVVAMAIFRGDVVHWWWVVLLDVLVPSLAMLLVGGLWVATALSKKFSALQRAQAWVVTVGLAIAFVPSILASVIVPLLHVGVPYPEVLALTLVAFPASVAYAILRHRLFELQHGLRTFALYLAAILSTGGLYAVVVGGGALLYESFWPSAAGNDLVRLGGAMLLAFALAPFIARLGLWGGGRRAASLRQLRTLNQRLGGYPEVLAQELVQLAKGALGATAAVLRLGERVVATTSPTAVPLSLCLPIGESEAPIGELCLGPRADGTPYDEADDWLAAEIASHAVGALHQLKLDHAHQEAVIQAQVAKALAERRAEQLAVVIAGLKERLAAVETAIAAARMAPGDTPSWGHFQTTIGSMEALLKKQEVSL